MTPNTFEMMAEPLKFPILKVIFLAMIRDKFGEVSPEQIMGYIYAVMYAPTYRQKYLELLKIDFPRIPFEVDKDKFFKLATMGGDLIAKHTMQNIPAIVVGNCIDKNNFNPMPKVEKVNYLAKEKKITINKHCFFKNVSSEVWDFSIGGYRVLAKYLQYRKERTLTNEEIKNIENIVKILAYTLEKMQAIEKTFLGMIEV